jgi:hypothetical protein
MRIIAYTFEADVHCPACTYKRFGPGYSSNTPLPGFADECGVPYHAVDREGNSVHPVFDIDEDPDGSLTHCGDCRERLV